MAEHDVRRMHTPRTDEAPPAHEHRGGKRSPVWTVPLDEAADLPIEQIGGKASTLARLRRRGYPVPDGFVVTAASVAAIGHTTGPHEDAVAASGGEIRGALGDLGPEADVAVRSSGVAEDLAEASYAGQYESVLGVRGGEALFEAVRRCASSAGAERLGAYRASRGASSPAPLAVLVQQMVPAEAAGVAFSADPVTGDRDVTHVHAVRGLGERLVSGEATPDAWTVRDGEARPGDRPKGAIDARRAGEIADLARRVEAKLGEPQDIEWAVADGRTYLLQARPITALPTPPTIEAPPGPWMKDTVHYPGPITPLAATAYLPRLEKGGTRLCSFGMLMEGIRQRAIGWEAYGQPVPPSSDALVRSRIDTAVDLVRNDRPTELVQRWRNEWRESFVERIAALRGQDLTALDDAALDDHLTACLDLLEEGQDVHFQLFVPYLLAAYDLASTCGELLTWDLSSTLDLVSGLSDASAGPTLDLAEVADLVRERPEARRLVEDPPQGDPLDALERDAPEVAACLQQHLERFGCRVPAYDVGDPTYAERPELTLQLLHDLVAGTHDPRRTRDELARTREATAERARRELAARGGSREEHDRFETVLARARDRWGLREENLLYTDAMPNGLIRFAALEIGRRLVERNRLKRADDAPWLELNELRDALLGREDAPAPDLPRLVDRRRREHAWVRAHPGPPLYGDPPPGPPPLSDLPPEARYVNEAMNWLMGVEYGPPAGGSEDADGLQGSAGSPGRTTGRVRIVRDTSKFDRLRPGEVLVCRLTTPDWTALFARASAVVTDTGSPLSHAAIVAREHGIPAVVGTQRATELLRDGDEVRVDGTAGTVHRAEGSSLERGAKADPTHPVGNP